MRTTKTQKYVDEIYENLSDETKERTAKLLIYNEVEKVDDGKFKISEALQNASNRVEIIPEKEVVAAISIATEWIIWSKTKERGDKIEFED